LTALGQLAWATRVLCRPARPLLAIGAVANLGVAAVWAVDRIWGLPIGPHHWEPEPVGFADSATTAFELLLALGCVVLLARPRPLGTTRVPRARALGTTRVPRARALVAALWLAAAAVTALGLLSAIGVG